MADRYWVGGSGTWNTTSTTNWSATSGGASGASVPTVADSVFFDQAATYTVTLTGALACLDITVSAGTVSFSTGTSPSLNVRGSLFFVAGTSFVNSCSITFSSTTTGRTITTNGVSFSGSSFSFTGVGGGWTLGSALNLSGASSSLSITNGTFDTGNYAVTASQLLANTSTARTINLGSSTVTLTFVSNVVDFGTNTNLTFNAGTSTIVCSGTAAPITIAGGPANGTGVTFYNLSFTGTASGTTRNIQARNTFNNIAVTAPSTAGITQVTFDSGQTINGTLSTSGTAGNRRVWFRSNTYGIALTLTVNAASLTDADFRDLYIIGTAAPISGTRIGNLRGCSGITFSTPKTVYWNLIAGGNWSANAWAASSGGAVSTDNFPLAQDTAIIENTGLGATSTITIDSAITYTGSVNMSTRTTAMVFQTSNALTVYGDFTAGSGTGISGGGSITYSGRNTQTITSAGKTFSSTCVIDSFGGTVQLADAFSSSAGINITSGTFDTKNYNVTATQLASTSGLPRTISLGSSTVTLSGSTATNFVATNLTVNAGTSQITCTGAGALFDGVGLTYNNLSITNITGTSTQIASSNTFNNVTLSVSSGTQIVHIQSGGNQTITGTLSCTGTTAVNRLFFRSNVFGTVRTLTVGTLSTPDCDFRDITIAGTAAGTAPTRAGDGGGNTGITFPAPKTVYWNLAGTQNWSATAWATSSGGTPDINNFPLAQDTAVFDNTGAAGTVTIEQNWNISTFNASARTSAMTLTVNTTPLLNGDWLFGTGVTTSGSGSASFGRRSTQTITSNGVQFAFSLSVNSISGTVQLADALSLAVGRTLTLSSGTFDAVAYNVTAGSFLSSNTTARTLRMGSGTWTLADAFNVWNTATVTNLNFFKGTANILLSDATNSAKTFAGGGLAYNKLTIGGATGSPTTTISGSNKFTELASTKPVAHTIALGSDIQSFGKWTVTGTVGNVVTLTGTGTTHILAGGCTSGIDYLAMGSIGFATTSPGEFYAGANSTGTATAPVYRTAKPADSIRYWVGGTGNWSDTARWSTSSGGASGASVPRSHDDVVFDSASNATSYTATVNAVTGGIRCKSLTIAGPASGTLTFAGSTAIDGVHGNVTFPATGISRTYTGAITLSSNSTGLTFTTNGQTLSSAITVRGVDCSWSLGSALTTTTLTLTTGALDFAGYNFTGTSITSTTDESRTINFGSGTTTFSGSSPISFGTTTTVGANLTVTAGTSQINCSSFSVTVQGNGKTFNNLAVTETTSTSGGLTLTGANTFNNLSIAGSTGGASVRTIQLGANQTVTGTFTRSAGTDATMRHFMRSDTLGVTRTLTAAAVSLTDVDFQDITIAGAAAPASGTRLGDVKGNSGITFGAPKTVYWNLAAGGNWSDIAWAASSGGTPNINNLPLAQDTAVIENTGLNTSATITLNQSYNLGTVNLSGRTNAMTFAVNSNPFICGNLTNGSGVTISGTNTLTFSGRGSQTITSAGRTWTNAFTINSPGGTVTLQDAFTANQSSSTVLVLNAGTLDANGYNLTLSGGASRFSVSGTAVCSAAIGSGTWTVAGSGTAWSISTSPTLFTVTGTGTISLTSASAKSFDGNGVNYGSVAVNQGGAGTLTINGNNTLGNITNTYSNTGAAIIALGTTTQRVAQFTATGASGSRGLTITGNSAAAPGTLVLTGATKPNVDYLTVQNVRAYSLDTTWYAGRNSTNNGSLGWYFEAQSTTFISVILETATGTDLISARGQFNRSVAETGTGTDSISARPRYPGIIVELGTGTDSISADQVGPPGATILETASGADVVSARVIFGVAVADTATGTDATSARGIFIRNISETGSASDLVAAFKAQFVSVLESATGTDAFSARFGINASVADTATGSDTPAASKTVNATTAETATAADIAAAALTYLRSVSETATAADVLAAVQGFAARIAEVSTGTDTPLVAPSVFNAPVVETATATDNFRANSVFYASVTTTVTIGDTVVARFLWEPIDDTQNANWQTIPNTQTSGWTVIDTRP